MNRTLPENSETRKRIPLFSGCYKYFPAALAGVAIWSEVGNSKHNPGQPLHHARGKSMDHADCIARHSMDLADMLAQYERSPVVSPKLNQAIIDEARALCWRSLAWSQELHERFAGAPLAPGARIPHKDDDKKLNAPNPIQLACGIPEGSRQEELHVVLDKAFKMRMAADAASGSVVYPPGHTSTRG